jgi:hypothetical protein
MLSPRSDSVRHSLTYMFDPNKKRRSRYEAGRRVNERNNFQFLDRFHLGRYESDSRKPRTFLPENWRLLKPLKTHPETVSAWSQHARDGQGPRSVSVRDVSCFPRRIQYRPQPASGSAENEENHSGIQLIR